MAKAYMDQLRRTEGLTAGKADELTRALDRAEAKLKSNVRDAELSNELTVLSQGIEHKGLYKTVSEIASRLQ